MESLQVWLMSHHLSGQFVRCSKYSMSLDVFFHPCLKNVLQISQKLTGLECLKNAAKRWSSLPIWLWLKSSRKLVSKTFNSFDHSALLLVFKASFSAFMSFFNAVQIHHWWHWRLHQELKTTLVWNSRGYFWVISIALRSFVASNNL